MADPCVAERDDVKAARRDLNSAIRDGASERAIAHFQEILDEAQGALDSCEAAHAAPLFVRFQFKSTTFAELVRDQIARSNVGCIAPTARTESGFVVERIEFPPASGTPMDVDQSGDVVVEANAVRTTAAQARPLRPNGPGNTVPNPYETITIPVAAGGEIEVRRRRLLLTLPITLHVRTVGQLGDDEIFPFILTVDAQLRVDLVHRDDGDFLRVGYDNIGHREGNDPAIEQLIREEFAGADPREAEFPYTESVLAALEALGGGVAPRVVWSGMTLSPDRETVEMRVEVTLTNQTGTTDPDAWAEFLGRQIDDFRTDHDWAVEIGRELLEVSATAAAREQVADREGFDLWSGPYLEWRPDLPGFRTTLTGEVIDACNCAGFDIDVNASIEVMTTLDLAQSGPTATFEVKEVTKGHPTNGAEEVCCAITGALLFPILGWKFLADGRIDWGGLAVGLYRWPLSSLHAMAAFYNGAPPELPLAEACRKEGDDTKICTYEISLNADEDPCAPAVATIFLDQLRGRNSGLVLAGAIDEGRPAMPEVSTTTPTSFEWHGPRPICFVHNDDPLPGPPDRLRVPYGTVGNWSARSTFEVKQEGGFPLEVCDVIAVGPANAIYQPRIVSTTSCPTTATIEVNTVEWTPGNPDPQPLVVVTNVGNKLVMLPPLPPVTEEDERVHEEFVAWYHRVKCGIVERDRLTSEGRVDAMWMVEQPTDAGETQRLWVIRAGGLRAGEQLIVSDSSSGEKMAIAEPDAKLGVRLDLLHEGDGLQITCRPGNGEPAGPTEDTKIAISQVLLEQIDVCTLAAPVDGLRPIDDPARPAIEVTTGDRSRLLALGPSGMLGNPPRERWRAVAGPKLRNRHVPTRVGRVGRDKLSDQTRSALAHIAPSTNEAEEDGTVTATINRRRWIVDRGADGFVELDDRAGRVTNRYRTRPWFDGMIYVNGVIARLDDDRSTLRTYRVVDSVTL